MRERESLAQLVLGTTSPSREKWLTEHLSWEELYPWPPRSILPKQCNPKGFLCVEIIGLPESGKTSGYQFLLERLSEDFPEVVGVPEFGGEKNRTDKIKNLEDEVSRNALLNFLKLISFQKGLVRMTDLLLEDVLQQRQPEPKILVCERGPNDEIAFLSWICRYLEARKKEPTELEEDILRGFLECLVYAERLIDAVVLYGVSLDTAKQRRRERGLPPEGKVTNKSNWPKLEDSYSWWLGSIFPLLRQRRGTGLLVIDGESEKEENNLTLFDYVKKVTALAV